MRHRGCGVEADWPYDIARFQDVPTAQANQDAHAYTLGSFHRAANLIELKQAIGLSALPVALAISVFDSFESPAADQTGVIPMPNLNGETLLGGHEILGIGYDDTTQRVAFKNSWATTWGDLGYGYLPYAYFAPELGLVSDAWVGML